MRYPQYIEENFLFPEFYKIKINHPHHSLKNLAQSLIETLDNILLENHIKCGDSVAIGVGSRGIANLPLLVKTLCEYLSNIGAKPFIIPSMGSHGGATSEGQKNVIEKLGVTEKFCKAPILSTMNVDKIGEVFKKVPVYFSRDALAMTHSICINRIKPHTKFKGEVESGIAKMLCVGMGKHKGALTFHNMALKHGFSALLKEMANTIIEKSNFRFGLSIIEDSYDDTMEIHAIPSLNLLLKEAELLKKAKEVFPNLPVKKLDVLIINNIGKEISGSGMDPNITGRAFDLMEDDFSDNLDVTRIAILNLSKITAGNGIGLGNADFITEKVYKDLDYQSTIINALTSMSLRKAFIPLRLPTDQKAIQAAFSTIGPVDIKNVRAIIIKDTKHTASFWASEALLPEIKSCCDTAIIEKCILPFDKTGNLQLFT